MTNFEDFGSLRVRKVYSFVEDTFSEAGRETAEPLRKVAIAAIIKNEYAGRPYSDDLSVHIDGSVLLGQAIAEIGAKAMTPFPIESYGKAALVGIAGEQEHGVALLTTVYGNVLREAVGGGAAWISSVTKRAAPGQSLDIPLAHKDALFVRSHYDAMTVMLSDAPLPDEIAVICCFASGGRLNHRVGGLCKNEISGQDGLR